MKAANHATSKRKKFQRLESPAVKPSDHPSVETPTSEAVNPLEHIDWDNYPELQHLKELLTSRDLEVSTCETESWITYERARALLVYSGMAVKGMGGDVWNKHFEEFVMDSAMLQLEKIRLMGEVLYSKYCSLETRKNGQPSKPA